MNRNFFDRIIEWIEQHQRRTGIYLLLTLVLIFFILPPVLTKIPFLIEFNEQTGAIGDTIGGTTAPLIALIASALTFFAFWVQYKANQQQRIDLRRERFENKLFEMLRLHKDNVNEMIIEGYDFNRIKKITSSLPVSTQVVKETTIEEVPKITSGRKVFVTANTELKACYEICHYTLRFEEFEGKDLYLIKLAYRLFFNGIDSEAVKNVDNKILNDSDYIQRCKAKLKDAQKIHENSSGANKHYNFPKTNHVVKMYFKYKPFSGHSARFGHYYRHLFLMVKYVVDNESRLYEYAEARDYLRLVRAQLSKYEQLMLYFNYLSGYGRRWENGVNKYFSRYRMIHNLPIELTDFTISPEVEFRNQISEIRKEEEEMFEYFE